MKSNNIITTLKVSVLIAMLIFNPQCWKKEEVQNEIKGNILFLVGSVEIIRERSKVVTPNLGYAVRDGDIIKTGDKSQLTIQIGDRGCLRIEQNTEVKINKIFMKNETDLLLENGKVISKISKLFKDENYGITTRTVKAAVRGTAFSVSAYKNGGEVAVFEGKVLFTVNEKISKEPVKETFVNAGEMVLVETAETKTDLKEVKIQVMPIDKARSIEIKKVTMIELVPDIENVTNEELNRRQQEMLKKEEELDKGEGAENVDLGITSKVSASTIEQLIKQKTRTLDEIKRVNGRIDEIALNSGEVVKGAIISKGNVYSVLTTKGVVNVPKKDINTINVIK